MRSISSGQTGRAYISSPVVGTMSSSLNGRRAAAQMAVILNRNGAFDLSLLEVDTGAITDLRSGQGFHSNPNWAPDGSFITFEYESPLLPPDLYRMEISIKQVTQLTYSNPPAMQKNKMVVPEIVCYNSFDGLEIPAFLYTPEKPNGAAIVYPHGGPKDQYGFIWDELAQYFTAKGYFYLAPNYRGSTGYGKQFERANYDNWGVGDTQDCLHAAKYLRGFKEIRPESIGIAGGSYGGYMTVCSLSRDPEYLFACGVSKYGDSNLVSSWALCEKRLRLYTEIFLGHPAVNNGYYLKGLTHRRCEERPEACVDPARTAGHHCPARSLRGMGGSAEAARQGLRI